MHGLVQLVWRWGEMVKFSHSLFALPFALMATFLAARAAYDAGDAARPAPSAAQLGLIVLCMVAARSTAMTFNRMVDAAFDAKNPRTATRAIPTGLISSVQAGVFLVTSATLFILGCAGFWWMDGNIWPPILSLPVLGYLCLYSYAKRFTRWSHFVLGGAIALSPVAAWLAIHPASCGVAAWILMAAVATWIAGFDIIYACQDVHVDRTQGLHSLPAELGIGSALRVAWGVHLLTVLLLLWLAYAGELGFPYLLGVCLVTCLLFIEHRLVSADDLSRVNLAFFTINGLVSLVLGLLTVVDVLVR